MAIDRATLLRSLERQKRVLADSIVLTPVDSLPFSLADREHTAFLHGLYLTDKTRDREARKRALILFGGREAAIDDIAAIHRLLAESLDAAEGSLRLLSGLHAHAVTFMSISTIGQTVMLLPEEAGGHFSTHAILARLGLRTIDLPIDRVRLCVDRETTLELLERTRPDIIFIDRSEGLRYEDFSFIGGIDGPAKVFDASQYLAPILAGRYENPLRWGFDLMLFTLHKSFPGPQKAGIVSRDSSDLWRRLLAGLSTMVSSSHAENTYLVGLSLLRRAWMETYVRRLLDTATELEAQLTSRGVPAVERARQGRAEWPGTHHIWIQAPTRDEAFAQYERLTSANVHTNYRKLPYELGYGLRLGTTHAAIAGIGADHVEALADVIAAAIDGAPSSGLRERVRDLAQSAKREAIVPATGWSPSAIG